MTKNLLVELFVEELPPKALCKLDHAFSQGLLDGLRARGLAGLDSVLISYATPRRLAVHITNILSQAADKAVSQKLMPVAVGLDVHGKPTPALSKKMQALGLTEADVSKLTQVNDGKADVLMFDSMVKGAALTDALQATLEEALAKLPIPKLMSYQLADGHTTVQFVRPAHGLIVLHGEVIIPISVLGLTANRITQGHRFEAKVPSISITNADSYAEQLKNEGAVIASFTERRAEIFEQLKLGAHKASVPVGIGSLGGPSIKQVSPQVQNQILDAFAKAFEAKVLGHNVKKIVNDDLKPIEDDALLDEVTALVEQPNVLLCKFESEFLTVPQECLILTMKANQKYFPLLDSQGKLSNQFLIVSNISPADPSRVIEGNERVVRPRLADAKFFFDQDRKKTLESRVSQLAKVVYHNKLGTQGERIERVARIATGIVEMLVSVTPTLKANATETQRFASEVQTATRLSKADLVTDMVGEFPELQGIMGRYYALNDGHSAVVADAIEDHYKPRFAGDTLPRSPVGMVAALADKLETLAGLFSIGQIPTGDKDPFALRRHALGVIRMLVESKLPLMLSQVLVAARGPFPTFDDEKFEAMAGFIYDRAAGYAKERGFSTLEVDAVLAKRPQQLTQLLALLDAAKAFNGLVEAPALAAANKRIQNILKKSPTEISAQFDVNALVEAQEKVLAEHLSQLRPNVEAFYEQGQFTEGLKALAALKTPVDAFFDNVLVNAEDATVRANRLGLLASLNQLMNGAIDISKLAV